MIHEAIYYINNIQQPVERTQSDFKIRTNLPPSLRIHQGARVMYLNNSLIEKSIATGRNSLLDILTNICQYKLHIVNPSMLLHFVLYIQQLKNQVWRKPHMTPLIFFITKRNECNSRILFPKLKQSNLFI